MFAAKRRRTVRHQIVHHDRARRRAAPGSQFREALPASARATGALKLQTKAALRAPRTPSNQIRNTEAQSSYTLEPRTRGHAHGEEHCAACGLVRATHRAPETRSTAQDI